MVKLNKGGQGTLLTSRPCRPALAGVALGRFGWLCAIGPWPKAGSKTGDPAD